MCDHPEGDGEEAGAQERGDDQGREGGFRGPRSIIIVIIVIIMQYYRYYYCYY